MDLQELIAPLLVKSMSGAPAENVEIKGIAVDSRRVCAGDLFICLPGYQVDGHDYAEQAVANGAAALLTQREVAVSKNVVQVKVPDVRRAMAVIADRFFNHPTSRLKLIGVTGTNGKTTVTHLISHILEDAGFRTGLIGTMYMMINGEKKESKNTTPDVVELQRSFQEMAAGKTDYAVIEVSSHALELGRVRGCDFHAGIFTNLTQDHLDFHETMENYRFAKSLLFSQLGNGYHEQTAKYAILNADDEASAYFAKITSTQVITYAIDRDADVRARDLHTGPEGTTFLLETFCGSGEVRMNLIGRFNVYNALAAIAVCLAEGIPLQAIIDSFSRIEGVRGRFERVDEGQDFTVVVDYAHTPDGLENVLRIARELARGKVICVVGCGGDRDRGKRPLMANISARLADLSVFTSDNPRSEDPQAIIDEMVAGLAEHSALHERYVSLVDRRKAIFHAVASAKQGDVVVIAGKGHEDYQLIKGVAHSFDDKQVAGEAIRAKKSGI